MRTRDQIVAIKGDNKIFTTSNKLSIRTRPTAHTNNGCVSADDTIRAVLIPLAIVHAAVKRTTKRVLGDLPRDRHGSGVINAKVNKPTRYTSEIQ